MRDWVAIPGSTRGDLALAGVRAFARHGYSGIGVGELARAAGVTTGALYHHFGSKLGLYRVVREDVERRVVDRMEGAAAARAGEGPAAALREALLVGFDWATGQDMARLLAEPHPERESGDPLVEFASATLGDGRAPLASVVLAGWRAALRLTLDGVSPEVAREAWSALRFAT